MYSSIDFLEKIDREKEYKLYLSKHFEGVESAFERLIKPLFGKYSQEVDNAINLCGQQVPLHDLSKMSADEFDGYRMYRYPTHLEDKEAAKPKFDLAVLHHYSVNPHHPFYWVTDGVKRDMPLNYIFEMLCDWASVAAYYKTRVVDFYDKYATKEKEAFSENTKVLVDYWVNEIFRKTDIAN